MSPIILKKIEFRNLRKHEIPQILDLCAKEGRNMGTASELLTWFEIDKDGFFVAVTEEGEIVGSCAAIKLSQFHGNLGMFVVKEPFRNIGIGTKVWDMAINHLGKRNKGLSSVPKLLHIYVNKAHFNKVAAWDIVAFKLNGKRLLENLENFLKISPTKTNSMENRNDFENQRNNRLDELENKYENKSDDSFSESRSSNRSSRENLNSIIENEELTTDSSNEHKNSNENHHLNSSSSPEHVSKISSNCLKDITNEITNENNLISDGLNRDNEQNSNDYLWIKKKKSNLNLFNDEKLTHLHAFDQLIYSKPYYAHLNSFSNHSTIVFHEKPSSPSISLPSLHLNSDSFSIFDRNSFNDHTLSSNNKSFLKKSFNHTDSNNNDVYRVIPYSQSWLNKLIAFDEQLTGYDRSKIVSLSVNEANSKTYLAIKGKEIVGYGIVKFSLQNTWLIGPLYCDSQMIARDLINEFVRSMSIQQLTKGFVIKLPNFNHKAIELMDQLGFEKQDYLVTRCFTDYVPNTQISKIFGMQSTIFSSE